MDIDILNQIPKTGETRNPIKIQTTKHVAGVSLVGNLQATDQELQTEGKNEQTKNEAVKKEEDKQTINDLIKKSNRSIIRISSLFPWDLFPNSIDVEEDSVTFVFRQFLASQSHSVNINDISSVLLQSTPFFASLQIVSRSFVENDFTIGHLNARKAKRVHMIIEGLRTFAEHSIDTSNYQVSELIGKIEEFNKNKKLE